MRFPRRRFLHLAVGAAALPAISRIARAQTYPSRPVRWFVGYPAGGPTDIIARIMAQYLSEKFGQAFVVENRPGSNSNVATEAVVRAQPDGYTLIQITLSNAINATLYDNLSFDLVRDIAPIASINRGAAVMEVNPLFPAKTVPEFMAYAKANPGKINMASGPNGSPPHIFGELFKALTGIKMLTVPYRGSAPALVDLMGGHAGHV
jgi:tripartite-type tricarboxylate transporter receptor subunit TctC